VECGFETGLGIGWASFAYEAGFWVTFWLSVVVWDSVVLLEGGCGCPHGGVGSAIVTSSVGCGGSVWGLTWPFTVRLLPAMVS
jgi:hypothetical protein